MDPGDGVARGGNPLAFRREPVMHPPPVLAPLDEPGLIEDGEVFRYGGRGELEHGDDMADAKFAAPQGVEDADPVEIGEGFGDGENVAQNAPPHFVM